jgi:hypothetical protein
LLPLLGGVTLAAFTVVAVLTAFTGVASSTFASFLTLAQRAFCARAIFFLSSVVMTGLASLTATGLEIASLSYRPTGGFPNIRTCKYNLGLLQPGNLGVQVFNYCCGVHESSKIHRKRQEATGIISGGFHLFVIRD